jgi:alpha-amylase/alpha-mannosidase (GH57 family)
MPANPMPANPMPANHTFEAERAPMPANRRRGSRLCWEESARGAKPFALTRIVMYNATVSTTTFVIQPYRSQNRELRMAYPLYVAFVWHMHQPYYKDTVTGEYILPWARLHGAKEYIHMAEVLAQYPRVKATFNFVPSLIEQIGEYARGEAMDRALALSRQDTWSDDDKAYILAFFFSVNWDYIVRHYPRYSQLLDLRHQAKGEASLLDDHYYRDLVAWFNLIWLDHLALENDPDLSSLVEKGQNFTREDTDLILCKQQQYLARILPLYNHLRDRGQIEITTSPYYHPILPLLIDSSTAHRASPGLSLPDPPFRHPGDAAEQIRLAVEAHKAAFGEAPRGMWPSEGAVCPEILPILAHHGFRWFATDEAILSRSLGVPIERDAHAHLNAPQLLYQPYAVLQSPLAVLFRDHVLSDRIGFVYQNMDGQEAAEDLIHRLQVAYERLGRETGSHGGVLTEPYLVSIILDGENCWESYPDYGDSFLHHLYQRLSEETTASAIETVTVSEYLERFPPRETLGERRTEPPPEPHRRDREWTGEHLATGSWIGGNLETWIGEAEQNRAWEVLGRVREELVAWQGATPGAGFDVLEDAWRQIYIAEGSDWFWWYYSHNVSGQDQLFDQAFRQHLSRVYYAIGRPVPPWLIEPIQGLTERQGYRPPSGYIVPRFSAAAEAGLEWTSAGFLEPVVSTGSMQRTDLVLRRLYFGYNPAALCFRLEARSALGPYDVSLFLVVGARSETSPNGGLEPLSLPLSERERSPISSANWRIDLLPGRGAMVRLVSERGGWLEVESAVQSAASERVWEVSVPLATFGLTLGAEVGVAAALAREGNIIETLPEEAVHTFTLAEIASSLRSSQ